MQKYQVLNKIIRIKDFESESKFILSDFHTSNTFFVYHNKSLYQVKVKLVEEESEHTLQTESVQQIQIYEVQNKRPIDIDHITKVINLEYFGVDIMLYQNSKMLINKLQVIEDKSIDSLDIYQLGFQFKEQKILNIKKHPINQRFITVLYDKNRIEIFDILHDIEESVFYFDFNQKSNFKDQLMDFSFLESQENTIKNFDQLYIYLCSSRRVYKFGPIQLPNMDYDEKSLQQETEIINKNTLSDCCVDKSQLDLFIQYHTKNKDTKYDKYNNTLKFKNLRELSQQKLQNTRSVHYFKIIQCILGGKIFIKIQEGLLKDSMKFILQFGFNNEIYFQDDNQIINFCEFDLPQKQDNLKIKYINDYLFILNGKILTRIYIGFVQNIIKNGYFKQQIIDWQKILEENMLQIDIGEENLNTKDIFFKNPNQINILFQNKSTSEISIAQVLITKKQEIEKQLYNSKLIKELIQQKIDIPSFDIQKHKLQEQVFEEFLDKIKTYEQKLNQTENKLTNEVMQEMYDDFLDYQEDFEEQQIVLDKSIQETTQKQIELKFCKQKLKIKQQQIDEQIELFQEQYEKFNKNQQKLQEQYVVLTNNFNTSKNFNQTPDNLQYKIFEKNQQKLKQKSLEDNFEILEKLFEQLKYKYDHTEDGNQIKIDDQFQKLKIQIQNTIKN